MKDETEYQIIIGCQDPQVASEIVSEEEVVLLGMKLKELINTDTILITKTDIEYSFM